VPPRLGAFRSYRTRGEQRLLDSSWDEMDHVVGGMFKFGKKIGSGSFGELFLGEFSAIPYLHIQEKKPIFRCIFRRKMLNFLLFLFAAVNVQIGEEVAVKLVLNSV
jgi:hypothetical protein